MSKVVVKTIVESTFIFYGASAVIAPSGNILVVSEDDQETYFPLKNIVCWSVVE